MGEIAGFGMSSDAHHLTQPLASGAARAMRAALSDAGASAEIFAHDAAGYINAHGTGTTANDATETEAIRDFRRPAGRLPGDLTKSMHGHALGAAGAQKPRRTCALRGGVFPPTANFTTPDPACDST